MQNKYVPKILVAGDIEEFKARIGNYPANIIGNVFFFGEINGHKYSLIDKQTILLNGEIVSVDVLKNMVNSFNFDYIVFTDYLDFGPHSIYLANNVINLSQVITVDTLLCSFNNSFYSFYNESTLYDILSNEDIYYLLDFDSFLLNGQIYVKPRELNHFQIDVVRNFNSLEYPIFENLYNKIFDSIKDCCLRHYNAILLTAEMNFDDLRLKIYETIHMTDKFIIFVRMNSTLNSAFGSIEIQKHFEKIQYFPAVNGRWYILSKRKSENIKIYMVTHKKYSLSKLPEGYMAIHAGHALSEDLGYQGDDLGQSISELNPYLNEMTAAYWIWKNTSHDYVGIAHYRRFFTLKNKNIFSEENIITGSQARELLQKYDIIVAKEEYHIYNLYSFLIRDVGLNITLSAINMTKMMIERYQPDYLEVFNGSIKKGSLYKCNMIITRKYVYDSYCQWLFSFILEAEREFRQNFPIDELSTIQKRVFGFISERMLTVWLIKNKLRICELTVIENK